MMTFKTRFYLHCIQHRDLALCYLVTLFHLRRLCKNERQNKKMMNGENKLIAKTAVMTSLKVLFRHSLE